MTDPKALADALEPTLRFLDSMPFNDKSDAIALGDAIAFLRSLENRGPALLLDVDAALTPTTCSVCASDLDRHAVCHSCWESGPPTDAERERMGLDLIHGAGNLAAGGTITQAGLERMQEIGEMLRGEAALRAPQWRRVEDGLPTREGEYLVWYQVAGHASVCFWNGGRFKHVDGDVTHWQPITAPEDGQ